jgi:hypothetical protein
MSDQKVDLKQCGKCKLVRATEQFNKNKATSDGRQAWCKDRVKEHATAKRLAAKSAA